jgi:hypothetical protein
VSNTRKSVRDIYQQLRKDILGAWLDLPGVVIDRRRILADPAVVYRRPTTLKNKPLQFATQALLLPAALLGGLSAFVSFVVDPPPPQVERAIQSQGELEKIFKDGSKTFGQKKTLGTNASSPYEGLSDKELEDLITAKNNRIKALKKQEPTSESSAELHREITVILQATEVQANRSMAELAEQLGKAAQETRENQARLKSITKLNEIQPQFRPLIVGVGLVLNSLLFSKLIRQKFPNEDWTNEVHAAHLYFVAASLGPVTALAGALGILLEYAVRYDISWYLEPYNVLVGSVGVWGLFQLRAAARRLSSLRPQIGNAQRTETIVANRLFLSNLATQIIVIMVTGILGAVIFNVVYSRFLA